MRKVFLDCGANRCHATQIFLNQGFTDWEYHLFEPNKNLVKHYDEIVRKYPQVNFNYYNKAVWIEDGAKEFYFSRRGAEGSTIVKEKFSNKVDFDNPELVATFDFSSWVKESFSAEDYVILKIDIEGAEYEVLGKMVDDGTIDYANQIIVEWHGRRQMRCTQRHHDLYAKVKEHLTATTIPVYSDNERLTLVWPER